MPTYCYTNELTGEIHDRVCKMGKAPVSVIVKGKTYGRDMAREHRSVSSAPGGWPMNSDAMGCHPDQIGEMRKVLKEDHGISCDFTPDGRAILTGRDHRKRVARAMGMYDRNGGYGDPQRGT